MPTVSADSTASPEQLWAVVADLENWARDLPTVSAIRHVDGPLHAVGARYDVRQPGLRPAVYEVTEWEQGRHFTWVARMPGTTARARHTVTPTATGSNLALDFDWSGPLAGVVRVFAGRVARRMMTTEAQTFTRLARER